MVVQLGLEDAVYKVHCTHAVLPVVCTCISLLSLLVQFLVMCYGTTQPLSNQACGWQVTHDRLIQNEVMIHKKVDATVPFILKCHLDVFGLGSRSWLGLSQVAAPWSQLASSPSEQASSFLELCISGTPRSVLVCAHVFRVYRLFWDGCCVYFCRVSVACEMTRNSDLRVSCACALGCRVKRLPL